MLFGHLLKKKKSDIFIVFILTHRTWTNRIPSIYIWSRKNIPVHILAREDRWFERGVKESICVKLEQLSFNRGGGLQHYL